MTGTVGMDDCYDVRGKVLKGGWLYLLGSYWWRGGVTRKRGRDRR